MDFVRKHFHKILLCSCIILSLFNLINCWKLKIEYVILSENQILYIYSSLSQVIGAILGLIIAGYSIIDSKMKALSETDTTVAEYVEEVRREYYLSLIFIIYFSAISIIFCFIVIAIYDNTFNRFAPFFMTESIILFVFIMIELIKFVCYLSPNTIEEKGSLDKEVIDADYKEKQGNSVSKDRFSPFITDYNLLEKLIKDFASYLVDSADSTYKIQILESLDILLYNEIINREIYSRIDEFRRYRNALVHSLDADKSVNISIYEKLENIYKLLKSVYEARGSKESQTFIEKKNELLFYGVESGYSEVDRKILEYIAKQPNTFIRNIAEYTNYSYPTIRRRLEMLQKIGAISQVGTGKQIKWEINIDIF